MTIASTTAEVFSFLKNAVSSGPLVLQTLSTAIQRAEQVGGSGDDKLQSVLEKMETFASQFIPEVFAEAKDGEATIQAFMTSMRSLVNELVAWYNEADQWFVSAEHVLTGK